VNQVLQAVLASRCDMPLTISLRHLLYREVATQLELKAFARVCWGH
jgi:hypothetical protein